MHEIVERRSREIENPAEHTHPRSSTFQLEFKVEITIVFFESKVRASISSRLDQPTINRPFIIHDRGDLLTVLQIQWPIQVLLKEEDLDEEEEEEVLVEEETEKEAEEVAEEETEVPDPPERIRKRVMDNGNPLPSLAD